MSNDARNKNGHEVGYNKPLKHCHYRTGQSGNRRGRPKRRVTISDAGTAFDKALSAFIAVSENGTVC